MISKFSTLVYGTEEAPFDVVHISKQLNESWFGVSVSPPILSAPY